MGTVATKNTVTETVTTPKESVLVTKTTGVNVVTVGIQGPRGADGPSILLLAGEIINANSPIKVEADGKAYVASNLVASDVGKVVGTSVEAASIGGAITLASGRVTNNSWSFSAGPIFLGDRVITSVAPSSGFTQILATVESSTSIIPTLFQPFN